MTFVVAQLGARMHYAVARTLHQAGLLEQLYTDIYASPGLKRAIGLTPSRLRPVSLRRLAGRRLSGIPDRRVTSFPRLGLHFWARQRFARSVDGQTRAELDTASAFAQLVARRGLLGAEGVYAYSTAALEVLTAARQRGARAVLEQTMAPWAIYERLLREERELFPHWDDTRPESAVAADYARREAAEWAAADLIVCGSDFVRDGIASLGGPVGKCVVVPYGVDHFFSMKPRAPHGGKLRVLVVGRVGLRKGIPYVMEAARELADRAEIRVIGPLDMPPAAQDELRAAVDLRGQVPRAEILAHFAWADVFLLPSLCEGSATVTYEAMMASLPVICTPNTGSVVRDGIDGLIVPPRDAGAIVRAIDCLAGDAGLRRWMAENAALRGAEHDLQAYGERLLKALELQPGEG